MIEDLDLKSDEIPFKTGNNAGTIVWALTNATLGAYTAFTLLSRTRHSPLPGRRRIASTVLAALSLVTGCCACQLSTSRIRLEPPGEVDSELFISIRAGFVALSVSAAIILVISAFLLLDPREAHDRPERSIVWRALICSLLVGLSVFFIFYCPFLSLPTFKATFKAVQAFLVVLLVTSGALFSLIALGLCTGKYRAVHGLPCILHAVVSLIFGSCVTGARILALSGVKFEPKGSHLIRVEPSEGDRRQRDVLTLVMPAIMTIALACSAVILVLTGGSKHRNPCPSVPSLYLASIAFHHDGRILLNYKGMLPMQSVNLDGLADDVLNGLDCGSSTFQWLLAISFDWSIISPSLRCIITAQTSSDKRPPLWHYFDRFLHLDALLALVRVKRSSIAVPAQARLKLRLLEAATQLSAQLDLPLEELGTLHDSVLETGTRIGITEFLRISEQTASQPRDVDEVIRAHAESSRGLTLFFVRVLPQYQSEAISRFCSQGPGIKGKPQGNGVGNSAPHPRNHELQTYNTRGFRMRFMGRFRDVLAEATGANPADVDRVLNGCKNMATRRSQSVLEAGCTYVSLFAEQISCDGSSEVLVYDFAKHQLPSYRLDLQKLSRHMRDWLSTMSGFTAYDIVQICEDEVEQGRLLYTYARHDHAFTYEEEQLQVTLLDFKEALAKALTQLMRNMSFVSESLETSAYLTAHVIDAPAAGLESNESPPAPAHMIIFHAEVADPLDADLLETESNLTHLSTLDTSRNVHQQSMPSVFEYIPRTLFDVVHALAICPPAREAFRAEATRELNRIIPTTAEASDQDHQTDASDTRVGPGRLSCALKSSFSVDSLSDDENVNRSGAVTARVRKSWAAVKARARGLTLSPGKSQNRRTRDEAENGGRNRNNRLQYSQSASRSQLLSHSHSGSSSTATTSTATSYSIPEPQPSAPLHPQSNWHQARWYLRSTSKVNGISHPAHPTMVGSSGSVGTDEAWPLPSRGRGNSARNSDRSSGRSRSLSRSKSRAESEARRSRCGVPLTTPVSAPLPVPPLPFRTTPRRAVSSGNRAAFKSAPDVRATKDGFF